MTNTHQVPDRCWFCDTDERVDLPAGGWLLDDGVWRAGHVPPGYSGAGTVILESRRHVLDQQHMNEVELATLGAVTGRLLTAVGSATGCDRVYQWATMDGYPHFHLWLIPWWVISSERGPRYLVSSVSGEGCTSEQAEEAAERLKVALGNDRP